MLVFRSGGQLVILRGFPQHAPQDEKFQLLPSGPVSRRLRISGHFAARVAEQQYRGAGVQQGGVVSSPGVHQLCLQFPQRLVDRRFHSRTFHSHTIPTAPASYVHNCPSQSDCNRPGRSGAAVAPLFLRDSWNSTAR